MNDATSNAIMAWSECTVKIGETGANDAMATDLFDVGAIKDKSSTLEPSDGDTLEMKKTGGSTYAKETGEGGFTLNTRVIEPDETLLTNLGLGESNGAEFQVNTHVVDGYWSVEVTPKNVGAIGIRAPKTSITYKPGWSEEDGNYADLSFEILKGQAGYWYSRFKKLASALPLSADTLYFSSAADESTGKTVTVTTSATSVTATSSDSSWCTVAPTGTSVKVTVKANETGAQRTALVTIKAEGKTSTLRVVQIPA